MINQSRTELVKTIMRRVNKVCRESKERRKLHWSLQKNLLNIAKELGFLGWAERNCHEGRYDVIWYDENGREYIVFEIDSFPRPRSVYKLNNRIAPIGIWIYYGVKAIPEELDTSSFIVIRPAPENRRFGHAKEKPKPKYPVTIQQIDADEE